MIHTTSASGCHFAKKLKGASFSRSVNTQFNVTRVLAEFVFCSRQFFKIRVVFQTLFLGNEAVDPPLFAFLTHVSYYLTRLNNFWKFYGLENFCANVLKPKYTVCEVGLWFGLKIVMVHINDATLQKSMIGCLSLFHFYRRRFKAKRLH